MNELEMATGMTSYAIREKLPELWKQIDNTHFSYLETDDSPEKLEQRKKLEGYIMDYLCLVPHESKFFLQETGEVLSHSALSNPDFSGYSLARGWAAIARYAGNLISQPWRKEYTTIKLFSGFYKHEVEGSGLCGAVAMLCAMGYKCNLKENKSANIFVLDGPVCPDQVAAVSRDSLIAYVECQIMTQIWEEVSMRGGTCSWLEILRCRETYVGDVEHAVTMLLHMQRISEDMYCNVKYPVTNAQYNIKDSVSRPSLSNNHPSQMNGHAVHSNGHSIQNVQPVNSGIYINNYDVNLLPVKAPEAQPNNYMMLSSRENQTQYCSNPMANNMNHVNGYNVQQMYTPQMNGYYCNPMPGNPYVLPQYSSYPQSTLPLMNGYHYPNVPQTSYYPNVPTGRLIELDTPPYLNNKPHCCPVENNHMKHNHYFYNNDDGSASSKDYSRNGYKTMQTKHEIENHENARRNSAPKSVSNSNDRPVIPRSDTQPSLSKAKEDGMGTFESWDYVFRNLESQGYSKDLCDVANVPSPSHESKTLGRVNNRDVKKYQQTTMDLEDALRAMSLEKNSDEELFRTAKVNETLMRIKQETEAKVAKANMKRQILADEREKRKSNSYDMSVEMMRDTSVIQKVTDKTRLISKEDHKIKKEIDKEVFVNGNGDSRKSKKSVVKCLSSEDKRSKKTNADHQTGNGSNKENHSLHNGSSHHASQSNQYNTSSSDTVDAGLQTRLVVALNDFEVIAQDSRKSSKEPSNCSKQFSDGKWECGTCTYLNSGSKKACEICGKSKQVGVEALPLTSGGKECPACTLVNQRDAVVCAACDTSLKHSPTYI